MKEVISPKAAKLVKEGIPLHKAVSMAGMGSSPKKNNPKPMSYSKNSNPGY
jgi:hypothetical protein